MAVYVDSLCYYGGTGFFKDKQTCHLLADTKEELVDFAVNSLGMNPRWLQDTRVPHFDLVESRRRMAVENGAIELSRKDEKLKELLMRNINGYSRKDK